MENLNFRTQLDFNWIDIKAVRPYNWAAVIVSANNCDCVSKDAEGMEDTTQSFA